MKRTIRIFSGKDKLANHMADFISKLFEKNIGDNSFSIAVSGGSTPGIIYNSLAVKFGKTVNWENVKIFFVDERCVSAEHSESNFKMVNETLLKNISIPSENIFRIIGESNPGVESKRYSEVIKNNIPLKNGIPQFDLVMLGIGEDGHTASIFPNQIEKFYSKNICETATHPESGQNRITITGEVINNAKLIVFIVTGENKSKIVSEILEEKKLDITYPASLVSAKDGNLIWILDSPAAQLLESDIKELAILH